MHAALPVGSRMACLPSTSSRCCLGGGSRLHSLPHGSRCTSALPSRHRRSGGMGQSQRHTCCAVEGATSGSSGSGSSVDSSMKKTMSDLDALLGIQEEKKEEEQQAPATPSGTSEQEIRSALQAEAQRLGAAGSEALQTGEISDQMKKILEKAKLMADDGGEAGQQQAALRREFESLLTMMFNTDNVMDKNDIKRLKDSGAFGPLTFWVTEIKNIEEADRVGVLVRGNLRTDRQKVFDNLCSKVVELFGDKYAVLMVEDPEVDGSEPLPPARPSTSGSTSDRQAAAAQPRVAFQVVPSALVQPPQTNGWKVLVAGILLVLLLASCVQLALVANITKLPKETLEYFSKPENLNSDVLPPGLEAWDPAPYLASAAPIFVAVLGINFTHELGHRIAAFVRKVKLGPTFFIPNLQIGSFGAITPFASLLKNRQDLWDVAAAGPLAGGLASASLLLLGLSQSSLGALPKELLVPVPTQLFQGSLLLGTITRLALGEDALHNSEVLISPLIIAGWCGLVTTALNMLPVGALDGGRMMQAAFGQQALSLSSFFTYVGLGLGLLGSSLSLPFGLYVLICQRSAERYIADSVSPISGAKSTATAVAVLTAILILIPMAPELAESVGVGAATDPTMLF